MADFYRLLSIVLDGRRGNTSNQSIQKCPWIFM